MSAVAKSVAVRPQAGRSAPKTMSIGVVLERLREEFPDITLSKIRFLEAEGLVTPQRTASGYRRFVAEDVERLRYILISQRDNYLPLKVIREQLAAMDSGQVTAILTASKATVVSPENFRSSPVTRLSDADLAQRASVSEERIAELLDIRLIHPDASGLFSADDVAVVQAAEALLGFGFDARHLRSLRNLAHRQADLISQIAGPVAKAPSPGAKQHAEELSHQLSALAVTLHAALVKNALHEDLGL